MTDSDKGIPRMVVIDTYIFIFLYISLSVLTLSNQVPEQWLNKISIMCACFPMFMIPVIRKRFDHGPDLQSALSKISRKVIPWIWGEMGVLILFALSVGIVPSQSIMILALCYLGLAYSILLAILMVTGFFTCPPTND